MSDCVREKEEGKEIHGEAIVTMIFFFSSNRGLRSFVNWRRKEREREGGRNKRNQEENNAKSARSLYTGD